MISSNTSFAFLYLFSLFLSSSSTQYNLSANNGQEILQLGEKNSNNSHSIQLDKTLMESDWRFSLLIEKINCNEGEYILLQETKTGSFIKRWNCSDSIKHSKYHKKAPYRVIDDLGRNETSILWTGWGNNSSATIVASIYLDLPANSNPCNYSYFNCNTKYIKCPNSYNYVETGSRVQHPRCIPNKHKCDGYPSCGYEYSNLDESEEVCEIEEICGMLMDWTYMMTRSLVAIVFVMIPTMVVFLLFHRRQVALHRARLLRQQIDSRNYSLSIIDMRGRSIEDLPPTYDDLYDTKDPPPCFWEAVGINPTTTEPNNSVDNNPTGSENNGESNKQLSTELPLESVQSRRKDSSEDSHENGQNNPAFESACDNSPH